MSKTNSQKRKEAKRIKRKKELAKKKFTPNSHTDLDKIDMQLNTHISDIYKDVQDQISNIEVIRQIAVDIYKLINKIVSLRLNIPYLTDEIRDKFKTFKTRAMDINDSILDVRDAMLKIALRLKDPKDANDAGSVSIQAERYVDVIQISSDLLDISSDFIRVHSDLSKFAEEFFTTISECDKLRTLQNATSIMPVLSSEEREIFTKYLGSDSINKIVATHENLKEDSVKELAVAVHNDISKISSDTTISVDVANKLTGDIISRSAQAVMCIGNNDNIPEYIKTGATEVSGAIQKVSDTGVCEANKPSTPIIEETSVTPTTPTVEPEPVNDINTDTTTDTVADTPTVNTSSDTIPSSEKDTPKVTIINSAYKNVSVQESAPQETSVNDDGSTHTPNTDEQPS